ncbi:MAG: glycosyltransferase [Phycisphaerales bacterium]
MVDPTDQSVIPTRANQSAGVRVALAHDWLVARRGGELVLDAIATQLMNSGSQISTIYTMFDSGKPITPAIDAIDRRTSSLNSLPSPLRRWLLPRYPKAVEQLTKALHQDYHNSPIDILISTSSAAIKSLNPPPGVPHLCYCHAPARYLWSQSEQYTSTPGFKSRLRAAGLDYYGDRLREWDQRTASHVTQFIANSNFIASEIQNTYNRDALVIHPPVRTDYFVPADSPRQERLLYVGALEPYKRVDLAIQAAASLNIPIDIAGTGSHESVLKSQASELDPKNHIATFHGHVSDEKIRELYQTRLALIQPQIEDFGITAVEAQACGCLVIARRAGGSLDSIVESRTGAFFDLPETDELAHVLKKLIAAGITQRMHDDCRSNALRFSYEAFNQKLNAVMSSHI